MFATLRLSDAAYERAAEEVFDRIDRKPILTLVYGGTERGKQFGPDNQLAGLRGAWGSSTLELSWSQTESLSDASDSEVWKLGYQFSRLLLKGSPLSKDGVTLSVNGTYEKLDDVPTAMYDDIGKLGLKVDVPLSEGLAIPISVTWANHTDLLTEEDEIRGHIGFTVNFSMIQDLLVAQKKAAEGESKP